MVKILLIEDDRRFREILKEELSESFPSIIIEEASDSKEAKKMTDSSCPELIFMDLRLPGESGLQLTMEIKSKCPGTKVAMLTSYDMPEYREAARHFGASYYFVKGLSGRKEINAIVNSLLHNSQCTAEAERK